MEKKALTAGEGQACLKDKRGLGRGRGAVDYALLENGREAIEEYPGPLTHWHLYMTGMIL